MRNSKDKKIYKHPFLFSIVIILIYQGFITALSVILGVFIALINFFNHVDYGNLKSIFKEISPLSIAVSVISILLINLIFKNLKIYTKRNFFKTVKVSLVYLIYILALLIYTIYQNTKINHQFKPSSEIILGILALILEIGFVEESLYRGLILNIFAKKYLDKPNGISKILFFPAIIFGSIHMLNILAGVYLEKAILQAVLAFLVGILLNAIYLRGRNILVLILIHAIVDASGLFKCLFLRTNMTFSDCINQTSYTELIIYIPLSILSTIFILRKSKLEEVKENLKTINQI